MKKLTIIGLLMLFALPLIAQQGEVPLIPMKDFFRNVEKRSYQISPNGDYLSFMQPVNSRMNVFIQKIGEDKTTQVTFATERDIAGYFWKGNNRIIYIQDSKGDENFRLFGVDRDGKNQKDLTPFDKVRAGIIDDLEDNPTEMLIQMNKENPQVFDVYRINVNTGDMKTVAKNPGNITGWQTDHDGKLRIAITTDGVNSTVLYRDNEEQEFSPLLTTTFKETFSPLFFTFDNKNLYVSSNIDRDKAAIVEYDIANKKEVKVLYQNPDYDVNGLNYSRKRKVIEFANYTGWKREYHFFDDETKNIYNDLASKLPGKELAITGNNKNEDKLLVRTYSDKSLGAYYFYDVNSKDLKKLTDVSPWLNENDLSDQKPITYKTRDGLTIHGYLTLPKGVDPKNLPVVINPHVGPWARDAWGFNPEVQFLANRGYAVLQMNFRGSTGYGREFWEKSFKQWGRTMQDDISDGVKWLVAEGIADPKRIGIYGGSYGGYATLAGLTFSPELYACGVDYVGVSNLFTFQNSIPPYWEPFKEMLYEMVGHPVKDSVLLYDASPVFHVDNIKAPLLIAQGLHDPRVNKNESDQMVEALKKNGIDVPYMVKDNEGHGFRNEENRFDFYGAMEQFFFKYLGGRAAELKEEKN
ncbi:MAG TPA: S9 family peptidase [Ignavibacteriaceae bacterium]|nr:S9 family peptidase [Ignavibacteriaceae bacterium]HRP91511.1 S9 family peptidase [Ignavibacteriaceae bacterium]